MATTRIRVTLDVDVIGKAPSEHEMKDLKTIIEVEAAELVDNAFGAVFGNWKYDVVETKIERP